MLYAYHAALAQTSWYSRNIPVVRYSTRIPLDLFTPYKYEILTLCHKYHVNIIILNFLTIQSNFIMLTHLFTKMVLKGEEADNNTFMIEIAYGTWCF